MAKRKPGGPRAQGRPSAPHGRKPVAVHGGKPAAARGGRPLAAHGGKAVAAHGVKPVAPLGRKPAATKRADAPRVRTGRAPQDDLLYGRHPIAEALAARPEALRRLYLLPQHLAPRSDWQALRAQAEAAGVPIVPSERAQLEAMVGEVVHQGAVAAMAPYAYASLEDVLVPAEGQAAALVLVLDHVQDPHNLGALVRSAAALGASGVVIAQDRSAEMTPTAIKASAGGAFHLPVARVVNLKRALTQLQERGLWSCALTAEGDVAVGAVDWARPMAVVVGAEGAGVRPQLANACDWQVHIPIARIGSLNASVAGAIALYAAAAARKP